MLSISSTRNDFAGYVLLDYEKEVERYKKQILSLVLGSYTCTTSITGFNLVIEIDDTDDFNRVQTYVYLFGDGSWK